MKIANETWNFHGRLFEADFNWVTSLTEKFIELFDNMKNVGYDEFNVFYYYFFLISNLILKRNK